jgi:uncharacterized membrane protein
VAAVVAVKAVLLTQCSVAVVAVVQLLMRCSPLFQQQVTQLQLALVALVVQVLVELMDRAQRAALHHSVLYFQLLVAAQEVTVQLPDIPSQGVPAV